MDHIKELAARVRTEPAAMADLFKTVCREVVGRVGSTRASIWSFNDAGDEITCECLLDTWDGKYSQGVKLKQQDFPEYFAAIKNDLKVVATEARTHVATSCFTKDYFGPLDIHSLLDFVILSKGEPVGVLCCEHCGQVKQWTDEHVELLHQLSTILSLVWKYRTVAAAP
ncbi:MAG: GAF domain-containing protein [Myxococcota bacterium]